MKFSDKDKSALAGRGIAVEDAEAQLKQLKQGFLAIQLARAATPGDGIFQLTEETRNELLEEFSDESPEMELLKFVPASGAATRMFKALYDDTPGNAGAREHLLENLEKFAFFDGLKVKVENSGKDLRSLRTKNPQELFNLLLNPHGLNFGQLPKGLVPFHRYPSDVRTAFEEHLYEGAKHALGAGKKVRLHYTVQREWQNEIEQLLQQRVRQMEGYGVSEFELGFSVQSPATDTLAITENGEPLRDDSGALMFRPGGHGALLHNLNNLQADLIFVKNIDNVVYDRHKYQSLLHKRVLGGLAIQLRRRIHRFCKGVNQNRAPISLRRDMENLLRNWLQIDIPEHLDPKHNKHEFLAWAYHIVNRQLRICGMVTNEGEPGGGPFWVKEKDGSERLQIVEKTQIDTSNPRQSEILAASTHFNPVDMVCVTRNYRRESYDLQKYTDRDTGFVSEKSHAGKNIKALELPGLWNGAMAKWNTVFVEVPIATFSPVKTVNDLLRPLHQG